ncbi:predicted protein [Botrytis cinerea T4]|uniref:Uncharacterized protein n=1 Tax=Botryotinia fuckeliana (strain T4) TaxID=999810 RepID=G2XQX6_BOTF4|nr:predicted protein [Botrytis cinerea T4]
MISCRRFFQLCQSSNTKNLHTEKYSLTRKLCTPTATRIRSLCRASAGNERKPDNLPRLNRKVPLQQQAILTWVFLTMV